MLKGASFDPTTNTPPQNTPLDPRPLPCLTTSKIYKIYENVPAFYKDPSAFNFYYEIFLCTCHDKKNLKKFLSPTE